MQLRLGLPIDCLSGYTTHSFKNRLACPELQVKTHVAKFSKPDLYLAIRTLIITAALYICFFAACPYVTKHWALWAIAAFLRGGLYDRIFVIFHDCCHGKLLHCLPPQCSVC